MNILPTFDSYVYDNNYGTNAMRFYYENKTIYFSYKTIVAFNTAQSGLVCRQNDWSTTTGKHLNAIQPDKSKRVSSDEFEKLCEKYLK